MNKKEADKETLTPKDTPQAVPEGVTGKENQETAEPTAQQFRFKRIDGRDQMKYEDVADK